MTRKIGYVFVDSGAIWVGDPCYVMGKDASHGVNEWSDFCSKINFDAYGPDDVLGEGVGFHIPTPFGDGSYPVFIDENEDGVVEITILFQNEEENDDWY